MIPEKHIKETIEAIQKMNKDYYINSGFALHLRGMEGELDDCDIRIFHNDLRKVKLHLSRELPYDIRLRGPTNFEKGMYLTDCIEFEGDTSFDVYSKMEFQCDFGKFEFPFNERVFKDIDTIKYGGLNLPVASAENLLLYYLALRRGKKDCKNDEKRIQTIIASEQFSRTKFSGLISTLKEQLTIRKLYNERSEDKI